MPNRWVGSGKTVIRRQSGGADPSQTSLLTSLISWWKLDEASGTRADSVVATGNDLTDNNTVTQAVGKVGSAGQFTASNQESLSRADNASLSTGDIDFTFAAWVNATAFPANNMGIGNKGTDGSAQEWFLDYGNVSNRFRFVISEPAGTNAKVATANNLGAPSAATWYFIVCWHDAAADTVNIQVNDGTANSTATATIAPTDGTGFFYLGQRGGGAGPFWDGLIDEAAFWKRTLTAAEKTYLYNAGAGRTWSAAGIV